MTAPEVSIVNDQDRLSISADAVVSLVRHVLDAESCVEGVEVAFVDDVCQSDLHLRFLGVAGPTDVITFPLDDDTPGGGLGEVVISTDTAVRQAADHPEAPIDGDPNREVLLYVVHGVLHLLGYDDLDEDSAATMSRRQDELFAAWWAMNGTTQ